MNASVFVCVCVCVYVPASGMYACVHVMLVCRLKMAALLFLWKMACEVMQLEY